jgi:hypothetical protein
MSFTKEDLKKSVERVGQIYPVLLDKEGNIIDGFHRKSVDPNWKEERLDVDDPLEILKIKVNANFRRNVPAEEKKGWVKTCRTLLQEQGKQGTQREIANTLGLSQQWVSKYDDEPDTYHKTERRLPQRSNLPKSNVWGLEDGIILKGDPSQPDSQFHHGSTPAFVIEGLVDMYKPKKVLDSMAGVGTTKYVCDKKPEIVEKVDQFDINPWPKGDVAKGDAENPPTEDKYDLIFNHIPYLNMVRYGDELEDLSNADMSAFLNKMRRIFLKNLELLEEDGKYSILVGDWRQGGKIIPLTAHLTLLGLECGFILWDEAVKLSAEQKGKRLQEYRANKHGYMPQNYDTVLIFKKEK